MNACALDAGPNLQWDRSLQLLWELELSSDDAIDSPGQALEQSQDSYAIQQISAANDSQTMGESQPAAGTAGSAERRLLTRRLVQKRFRDRAKVSEPHAGSFHVSLDYVTVPDSWFAFWQEQKNALATELQETRSQLQQVKVREASLTAEIDHLRAHANTAQVRPQ